MTERSTQTEIVCVWDDYETLQPVRSLGTSPVRCCEDTHRKRSRSNSRGSKRKSESSNKREYLMRPFGISDEEYNGSFQSARSYTPQDRSSWAPLSLNAPKNQEQCYIAKNCRFFVRHFETFRFYSWNKTHARHRDIFRQKNLNNWINL